jgi:hypothetical protein
MPPIKRLFLVLFLLVSCCPIGGCPESVLTLEPASRLPKWFMLPSGYTRSDVTVELTEYQQEFDQRHVPIDDAVFIMYDRKGRCLVKVTGQRCWHPIMEKKRNQHGGFDLATNPLYSYIRVNGKLEVIEHFNGPTFSISDDAALINGAIEATQCDKG